MNFSEQSLYDINLPSFIINFKGKILSSIIPAIDSSIAYLESANDVVIILLLILIFLQILRTILIKTPVNTIQEHSSNASENRQISKQVKDIKKELKSIQTMLSQLKSVKSISLPMSSIGNQQTGKIIKLCKESWQKRAQITEQILDWQLKIIKQVTKMKSKARSSRSPNKNNPSSSQHFSAQSKKSINSMIVPSQHNTIQPSKQLFSSQIKTKGIEVASAEEMSQPAAIQESIIEVKIQNKAINGAKKPSINVSVHGFKKQQENLIAENYQSIEINPSKPQAASKTKEQKNEQQEIIIPQVVKVVPSLPRPPLNFPRPPAGIKKETKRAPPPLYKSSMPSTTL